MLPRSALPAVALLTSFTICAVILTYINPITTSSRHTYVFEKHSRAWWATSRVAPSPRWSADENYNASADQQSSSSPYSILSADGVAPSLGSYHNQEGRQAQPQDDISRRCKHTLGKWCRQALSVNCTTAASPSLPGEKGCTAACNNVGNCNADTGVCDCPAGKATMQVMPTHLRCCSCTPSPLCPLSRMKLPVLHRAPARTSFAMSLSRLERRGVLAA